MTVGTIIGIDAAKGDLDCWLHPAGKPGAATTPCMRKLLTICNAIIKADIPWQAPIAA